MSSSSSLRCLPRLLYRAPPASPCTAPPQLRTHQSTRLAPLSTHAPPPHRRPSLVRAIHASVPRPSASSSSPSSPPRKPPPPSAPQRPTTGRPPRTRDRGPASSEDTQTDFSALDVLGGTPAPATGVDACLADGFVLNNGCAVHGSGVLVVGGEAFRWRPWRAEGSGGGGNRLLNARGQWEVGEAAWGVLDVVWPKPDLLIVGTGPRVAPLAPATREAINALGIRVEVQDTRNAAAQYNLLATERGATQVAAALVPVGWLEGGGKRGS